VWPRQWPGGDYELALFHADYGQRTVRRELRAFRGQAVFFQTRRILEVDLNFLGAIGGSSLTDYSRPHTYGGHRASGTTAHVCALPQHYPHRRGGGLG